MKTFHLLPARSIQQGERGWRNGSGSCERSSLWPTYMTAYCCLVGSGR